MNAFGVVRYCFQYVLVGRTHALQIDRKRRIPVAERLGVGDARIDRRQIAIGGGAGDRHDRRRRRSRRMRVRRTPGSSQT